MTPHGWGASPLSGLERSALGLHRRVGTAGAVCLITLSAVVCSQVLLLGYLVVTGNLGNRAVAMPLITVGLAVPLIVGPAASTLTVRLLGRLDAAAGELALAARTDVLIGALNRRGFFHAVHHDLPPGQRAVVGMADLDRFKDLNDRLGHEAGDRALAAAAELLRACLGPRAVLGRIGGDEFAFVLPIDEGAPPSIDHATISLDGDGQVGVSVGTVIRHDDESIDLALARADARLYANKRQPAAPRLSADPRRPAHR